MIDSKKYFLFFIYNKKYLHLLKDRNSKRLYYNIFIYLYFFHSNFYILIYNLKKKYFSIL